MEHFKTLYPLLFDLIERSSTMHALISIGESTRQSIDNIKFGCGVFINLRKAFDTIAQPTIIIEAMCMNGLSRIYNKESNL